MEIRRLIRVLLLAVLMLATFSVAAQNAQAREYLRRAQVFLRSGNLTMAMDFLQRAQKIDPKDDVIKDFAALLDKQLNERLIELKQRAQFFLDAKNVPEAEKLFNEVLELSGTDKEAASRLAEIQNIYEQVEDFKRQGINVVVGSGRHHDVDLYSAISHLNRARGLFANGEREQSLQLVEEVLRREPNYAPALSLKEQIDQVNALESVIETAEKAFLEGKMHETVVAISKLIDQSPDRYEYVLMRAKAYLMLKEFVRAEADLWKFYSFEPAIDKVLPLLADACFGQKKYLQAFGFSKNPKTDKVYKDWSFQLRCQYHEYKWQYNLLALLLVLLPASGYFAWHRYEFMSSRFSHGTIIQAVKCGVTFFLKSPEACLGDLINVARALNVPWVNYITAITLMKVGQIEGAQRFFTYSVASTALKARACYFMGLTRKLLSQRVSEADFEEAVLAGLSPAPRGWYPKFIKRIELNLLQEYGKNQNLESFEGMAYTLVSGQIGGKV